MISKNLYISHNVNVSVVFTFSLINYLKEVLVLDGVSVRWYMQTNFSRYYIFPYDVVYLPSFRLSPLNVCTSFLTNNFVSHNPAFKWRNAFSFFTAYLWVTNKFQRQMKYYIIEIDLKLLKIVRLEQCNEISGFK